MMRTEQDVIADVREITVVQLRLWVERGCIAPTAGLGEPAYDEIDVARIRLVCQLRDQLGIDEEALPVVLSLVDQLYGTRRELKALLQAIGGEPDEVRQRIRERCRAALQR
jgi:chaperone modulatory protein CbpM